MKKKWIVIIAIIGVILIGAILAGPVMSNVETPTYRIIRAHKNIEIRLYDPVLIAETEVTGKREDAIGAGFRLLADYIFGNNRVRQDIAMTAPVQQKLNQKIAMTAPVKQQSNGTSWKISFVMPSKYDIKTIPEPNDKRVILREIPSRKFAVIRFSGTKSDNNLKTHEKQLLDYLGAHDLTPTGVPEYAFYNPPWTLPPMRRNEIMIELE